MAFSIGTAGSILESFTDSLNEAFGGSNQGALSGGKNDPELFKPTNFGSPLFDAKLWSGNAYKVGRSKARYGFATITPNSGGTTNFNLDSENVFYLQTSPQSIQQKEIFGTNIQATRKGVIVESEGVVFKDIVISGNTGIFPGERGGSNTPSPNTASFEAMRKPPEPPSGVNADTGLSKKAGVNIISGYEEFIRLRQFFLNYARKKVESKGSVFFAFLNQKDNQYFVVEPLEFTMDRDARSPLTYNYRIVLRAIAQLDDFIKVQDEVIGADLLTQIGNISANIVAILDSSVEVLNAGIGALTAVSQAIDNTFLTPIQQYKNALISINAGANTVLALPATLAANAANVRNFDLAVASSSSDINTTSNNFATSQSATSSQLEGKSSSSEVGVATNDRGEITSTGPSTGTAALTGSQDAATINGKIPNLLDANGNLSTVLTPAQYQAVREVTEKLKVDPLVPLPRSFLEALRVNATKILNDFADSIGAGSSAYDDIFGRTVTQIPSPLAIPTSDQFKVMGAIRSIIAAVDLVLANNDFFQSDADEIYTQAQATYGIVARLNQPDSLKEATVELGDTLERIALREYGDALRWVDLVVINKLKAPYILNTEAPPKGVLKPGDKLLVGNT